MVVAATQSRKQGEGLGAEPVEIGEWEKASLGWEPLTKVTSLLVGTGIQHVNSGFPPPPTGSFDIHDGGQ